MPADPRLAAIPAVRAEAERLAGDIIEATRAERGMFSDHTEGAMVEGVLTLLSDLSRPASRDAVARLVAVAVGLTCDMLSPRLQRLANVAERPFWRVLVESDLDLARSPAEFVEQRGFVDVGEFSDSSIAIPVPGISAITDPAEALTLIALAVLGGPDAR